MALSVATARRWLSQAQAAEMLGVTERSVRNYIARGALPARRIHGSRAIRIDATDVEALLEPIPTTGGGRVA